MNNHLTLLQSLQNQPKNKGETPHFSDMDVISAQATLMEAGSLTFKAIKSGEISGILAGLVALAYAALQALAAQDQDILENSGENQPVYQMLEIMRLISEKVHDCSSGQAEHYSGLYYLCSHLATDFLNADFEKAIQVYHEWNKVRQVVGDHQKTNLPDLTDCLYE